jgi:putative endonuclease
VDKQPAVYILASKRNGTPYTGVTSDLVARIWEHREHVADGFTSAHGVTNLVWDELHDTMESAILREKRIKKWRRAWKIDRSHESLLERPLERNCRWGRRWVDQPTLLRSTSACAGMTISGSRIEHD